MDNNFDTEKEIIEEKIESCAEESAIENEPVTNGEPIAEAKETPIAPAAKKKSPLLIIAPIAVLLVAIVTVLCVLLLSPREPEVTNADYTVSVFDEIGNPITNVMVTITDSNGASKTSITNKEGKATFAGLLIGDYNVKLDAGFSTAIFDKTEYKLENGETSLKVVVRDSAITQEIFGEIEEGSYAYSISEGEYTVISDSGETSYLIFTTNVTGVFKVSFTSTDEEMTVGYYGIPYFVQTTHRGDGEYDGKTFEFTVQDTATPYVIGLNCVNACEATLKIERVGEAPFDPFYAPWTTPSATEQFIEFTTGTLQNIDITNKNLSVSLRDDGYYYTNTGKRVYLRITSDAPYIETSIAFIAGFVDEHVGVNFGGYVYDNGVFVNKYSYNNMIESYIEHVDANGVYPLTEELAEAIKCHGNSVGWLDKDSQSYLFGNAFIVEENAWLFLCCTE